jgi:hypothetical protein
MSVNVRRRQEVLRSHEIEAMATDAQMQKHPPTPRRISGDPMLLLRASAASRGVLASIVDALC